MRVTAASNERSEMYDITKDRLEDNFSYALSGIEKLARDGKEKLSIEVMNELNAAVESAVAKIADSVSEQEAI